MRFGLTHSLLRGEATPSLTLRVRLQKTKLAWDYARGFLNARSNSSVSAGAGPSGFSGGPWCAVPGVRFSALISQSRNASDEPRGCPARVPPRGGGRRSRRPPPPRRRLGVEQFLDRVVGGPPERRTAPVLRGGTGRPTALGRFWASNTTRRPPPRTSARSASQSRSLFRRPPPTAGATSRGSPSRPRATGCSRR